MTKRQLLLAIGTLVLAACRAAPTAVCIDAVPSAGAHHNADEIGLVECGDPQAGMKAQQ